jgi:hypothetical protein
MLLLQFHVLQVLVSFKTYEKVHEQAGNKIIILRSADLGPFS